MSEERKPLYRCRQIDPTNIDIAEDDEATKAFVLSLLHLGDMQAYRVYRHDDKSTTNAFYLPTKHILILFHNGIMEGAKDIPSMYLGLRWWIQEPDIWKEHIVSN